MTVGLKEGISNAAENHVKTFLDLRGLLLRNILIVQRLILRSLVNLHVITLPSGVPGTDSDRPFATGEVFAYRHSDLTSH